MINDSQLRKEVRHAVCQYVEYFVNEFQLGQIKKETYDDVLFFCAEILKEVVSECQSRIENCDEGVYTNS